MNIAKKMYLLGLKLSEFSEYAEINQKRVVGFVSLVMIIDVIFLIDQIQFRIGSYSGEQFIFAAPLSLLVGALILVKQLVFKNRLNKLYDIFMFAAFTVLQAIFISTQRDVFTFLLILSFYMMITAFSFIDLADMTGVALTFFVVSPIIVWNNYMINPIPIIGFNLIIVFICYYFFYSNQYRAAMIIALLDAGNMTVKDLVKQMNRELLRRQRGLEESNADKLYSVGYFNTDMFMGNERVVFLIFNQDRIFYHNNAFEKFYGEQLDLQGELKLHDFIEKREFYKHCSDDLNAVRDFKDDEFIMKRADGTAFNLNGYIQEHSGFQYFIGFDSTVDEEEKAELTRKLDISQRVHDIFVKSSETRSIDEIVEFALIKIKGILNKSNSGSFLKLSSDQTLTLIANYGVDINIAKTYRLGLSETYLYEFTQGMMDKSIMVSMIEHPDEYEYFFRAPANRKSISDTRLATIAAPVHVNGQFYGCYNFDTSSLDIFSRKDLENINYIVGELEKAIAIGSHEASSRVLSNHDSLTGLLNKRSMEKVFYALKENSESMIFAILKLPYLKEINERYTFKNGDKYILKLVDKLALVFDESAHMARYSGDEFIILEGNVSKTDIVERLEVLKVLLDNDSMQVGSGEHLTVKFKYAVLRFPDEGVSMKILHETSMDIIDSEDVLV